MIDTTKINKNHVKKQIVNEFGEDKWTECQGKLYSQYLEFATPFPGVIETIQNFKKMGSSLNIVSHKTKFPYVGEKVNLIDKSNEWIKNNLVDTENKPLFEEKQIWFTESIKHKISTILKIEATIFIDDLKHVLDELPEQIEGIWFNPDNGSENTDSYKNWEEIRNKIWQMNSI